MSISGKLILSCHTVTVRSQLRDHLQGCASTHQETCAHCYHSRQNAVSDHSDWRTDPRIASSGRLPVRPIEVHGSVPKVRNCSVPACQKEQRSNAL